MRIWIAPLFFAYGLAAQAETLDRIAASVGRHAILESDLRRDLRIMAFLDEKPLDESGDAKRRAAERLVDQELILREAAENRVVLPGEEEADRLLGPVKEQYGSVDRYQAAFAQYGVTEGDVRAYLLAAYRTLRFTDLRFRPEIQISEQELRDFYQLLAQGWRIGGNAEIPTFEESREQVEKLVINQKAIQALDTWLASTRVQIGVAYRDRVFE